MAVSVGRVVRVAGLNPKAVVQAEGGLVLGEATGSGIPAPWVVPESWSGAEDGGDGFGLFASGDSGADAEVVVDPVIEVADLAFDVGASGQDGP